MLPDGYFFEETMKKLAPHLHYPLKVNPGRQNHIMEGVNSVWLPHQSIIDHTCSHNIIMQDRGIKACQEGFKVV